MRVWLLTDRSPAESPWNGLAGDGVEIGFVHSPDDRTWRSRAAARDVLLWDRSAPGDGFLASLRAWRREGLRARLLVLLPDGTPGDVRAKYLDAGADVCLVHPVSIEEVRAYLRSITRPDRTTAGDVLRIHDLEIDTANQTVKRGGRTIRLTQREFDLLRFLAVHEGEVVSRALIRQHLYPDQNAGQSNVVDVYIRHLRDKIDRGFDKELILTYWGQGYQLRGRDE
jgi:DNA-binding response OmpR family regulator